MMRLARAFDEARTSESARAFARLATAVVKFWTCKRAPVLAAEALECLGGNGYVEESLMPRLYREAPVNSVWEGSGNVICLDVLRVMTRTEGAVGEFFAELRAAKSESRALDAFVSELENELSNRDAIEARARRLVERMALALQGSLLLRFGDSAVAEAFCASRLSPGSGLAFGTLPAQTDFRRIIERARPQVG